jgi:organic radical activating enzyme
MSYDKSSLYRFPWSMVDNPGGWVEVTDECNLNCPGCYRKRIEGHRKLKDIYKDIDFYCKSVNCDSISIAGGEPLIYPYITAVVEHIASLNKKPVIITNGLSLDWKLAKNLKKAGLSKFNFHIDSNQNRPGWIGKTEVELNQLRKHYADLVRKLGKVQCGFNVTVFRSTLKYVPELVRWCRDNINKVNHLSLIAVRGLPVTDDIRYFAGGKEICIQSITNTFEDLNEINITSEDILYIINKEFADTYPAAYLNGTSSPETNKYLVLVNIGSSKNIYGVVGYKTIELVQTFHHLFKGRYSAYSKSSKVGRKVFILSIVDREIRKAFIRYLKAALKNPLQLFLPIYSLPIILEQPLEIINAEKNLCDGCINMMVYKNKLIHSCRLDEYRLFESSLIPVRENRLGTEFKDKE